MTGVQPCALPISAGDALGEAAAAGLGVIVKEAVGNGRLTSRNQVIADRLKEAAPDWSPDAIAMAACLRQPWASVVIRAITITMPLRMQI